MRISKATAIRIIVLLGAVVALEIACRTGVIRPYSMIPPSAMVVSLIELLTTRGVLLDIRETLTAVIVALTAAVVLGFSAGAALHALPRARSIVDPLLATYYSVPVFVFYPVFIVAFGLNAIPKTIIGFLFAVVVIIINTLNGLDRVPRVLWKTARAHRLGRTSTMIHIVFPCAAPYLFTGLKLAVAYAFVGVISSEFILSSGGVGYRISFAYNNFQSDLMYGLMLLVLIVVIATNTVLYAWDRKLRERRRGR